MRSVGILSVLGVAAALACACGGESDDVGEDDANATAATAGDLALDVNDVSILFPIGKDKMPVPAMDMDPTADKAKVNLYPQTALDDVAKFQRTQGVTSLDSPRGDRKNWRIVGFRFDPCQPKAPGIGQAIGGFPTQKITDLNKDLRSCDIAIRLVAQPFDNGRDVDTSAHLAFTFGTGNQAARDRIIKELQELKSKSPAPTDGVPLGVHPGLAADQDGTFAAQVKAFLVNELSQATLQAVASMGTKGGDPWIFAHGTIESGNHWEIAPITGFGITLLGKAKVQAQSNFAGSEITPAAMPGEANFVATTTPLFKGTPTPQQLNLAHQVNNPNIAGLFNTDCVSCHSATERSINKKIEPSADRYPVPKGVTGYVEKRNANHELPADEAPVGPNKSTYNFRNFGYFGGQATISHRTVNETALVVDHINRDLLKKQVGPGWVGCDDAKVWTCFRDGKLAAECLAPANGCTKPSK